MCPPKSAPLIVYLNGKQADVSKWQRTHPGGRKVFRIFEQRDATEQFNTFHSPAARKKMEAMLKASPPVPSGSEQASETAIGRDFAALTAKLTEAGLFAPNYADEALKLALTLLPGFLGIYLLLLTAWPGAGSCLLTFSFYLAGWTNHDYLHHAVIKGDSVRLVAWNNAVGAVLGAYQGYGVEWWRARHNTHHVCTNEIGSDPDIKTAPVLVFVRQSKQVAAGLNWAQRYQVWYYLPAMAMMDVYWRFESLQYVWSKPWSKVWLDAVTLAVHYAALLYVYSGNLRWLAFTMLARGFWTGVVTFATHYGEDVLPPGHGRSFAEQTSMTSRNIGGGSAVNILTGFISLQTEHHLFPMMPTANLGRARPFVQAFFAKHGLEYRESSLLECVRLNMKALEWEHLVGADAGEQ